MLWQLTFSSIVFSLLLEAAYGQAPTRAAEKSPPRLATTHTIEWQRLPLGEAVARLQSISSTRVFVDRRVDPNQAVNLSLANATADEIVSHLAEACSLGYARWDRLVYLGPTQVASRIKSIAAIRRREVATLPTNERQSLLERRRIVWPRLTEPRSLMTTLLESHGWRGEHSERIPHDLWAAGELPSLPLADQLTLLLSEFDLTYRIAPDRHAIEIVAVDWNEIGPGATEPSTVRRSKKPFAAGRQVFTIRVENQPVGKVLEQLGRRLGWTLEVDEAAIRAARRSLDLPVSFAVDNADEQQLLDALLAPAGLQAEIDGKNVRVVPR